MLYKASGGALLIEACLCLLPILFAMCLNLELVRRAQYELVVHHALFLFVRYRALGLGERESRRRITEHFGKFWEDGKGPLSHLKDCSVSGENKGVEASLDYRYDCFLKVNDPPHKVFHMVRTCRFFF